MFVFNFVPLFCLGSALVVFANYDHLFQCPSCAVNKHQPTWVWVTFTIENMNTKLVKNRSNKNDGVSLEESEDLIFADYGQFSVFSRPLLPKHVYLAVMTFDGRIRAHQLGDFQSVPEYKKWEFSNCTSLTRVKQLYLEGNCQVTSDCGRVTACEFGEKTIVPTPYYDRCLSMPNINVSSNQKQTALVPTSAEQRTQSNTANLATVNTSSASLVASTPSSPTQTTTTSTTETLASPTKTTPITSIQTGSNSVSSVADSTTALVHEPQSNQTETAEAVKTKALSDQEKAVVHFTHLCGHVHTTREISDRKVRGLFTLLPKPARKPMIQRIASEMYFFFRQHGYSRLKTLRILGKAAAHVWSSRRTGHSLKDRLSFWVQKVSWCFAQLKRKQKPSTKSIKEAQTSISGQSIQPITPLSVSQTAVAQTPYSPVFKLPVKPEPEPVIYNNMYATGEASKYYFSEGLPAKAEAAIKMQRQQEEKVWLKSLRDKMKFPNQKFQNLYLSKEYAFAYPGQVFQPDQGYQCKGVEKEGEYGAFLDVSDMSLQSFISPLFLQPGHVATRMFWTGLWSENNPNTHRPWFSTYVYISFYNFETLLKKEWSLVVTGVPAMNMPLKTYRISIDRPAENGLYVNVGFQLYLITDLIVEGNFQSNNNEVGHILMTTECVHSYSRRFNIRKEKDLINVKVHFAKDQQTPIYMRFMWTFPWTGVYLKPVIEHQTGLKNYHCTLEYIEEMGEFPLISVTNMMYLPVYFDLREENLAWTKINISFQKRFLQMHSRNLVYKNVKLKLTILFPQQENESSEEIEISFESNQWSKPQKFSIKKFRYKNPEQHVLYVPVLANHAIKQFKWTPIDPSINYISSIVAFLVEDGIEIKRFIN